MKIAVYALWNLHWDGRTLCGNGAEIRYIRNFLKGVESLKLFTSTVPHRPQHDYDEIVDPKLEVVPLPWDSFVGAWLNMSKVCRIFFAYMRDVDAVYVRLFDPCAWIVKLVCSLRKFGLVYHVVGDPIAGIYERDDWSSIGKLMRRTLFFPEEFLVFRALKTSTVLINGSDLNDRLMSKGIKGEVIISSSLEDGDFCDRKDSCTGDAVKILFVGILRPPKRVEILIEAVNLLIKEGRNVHLRIVGSGLPDYTQFLKQLVIGMGISDRVSFAGYVPMGRLLNLEYRYADIFAFPSASEGSARSLLEAAANSLPIITTDVGSARDLFTNEKNALIVPPNNVHAMCTALRRFIDEKSLRQKCITEVGRTVKGRNVESYIMTILDYLRKEKYANA